MRIAILNMVAYGSTGKIMAQIAQVARRQGHEVRTYSAKLFSFSKKFLQPTNFEHRFWGSNGEHILHYILGSTLGRNGCYTTIGTKRLVRELKKFKPDILHLHNLHSYCINLPILFRYIKKNNVRVIWTLHDCWTFTGQCPHFDMIGCDKWKTGCHHCPQINSYPKSRIDNSRKMYQLKKKWFTNVKDMTLVTPSQWLADLTRQSYMREYPVRVIHNGIDLSIFKPTDSDFRTRYKCEDKKIVLGVAFGWGKRKGLDVFVELAKRLDSGYQIVLVGVDERVQGSLPNNIITIARTQNQQELAQIYSVADLFVNPTREENYPTVNMEALTCGTPVLTFCTGGSPEIIDEYCGSVVDKDDIDALHQEIIRICSQNPYKREDILRRAEDFDMANRFNEYINLYHEVINE